jgi:hypothetical protein
MRTQKIPKSKFSIVGFTRVQLKENGELVGDSGWSKNMIVDVGIQNFIMGSVGAVAGSKQVGAMAVGTAVAAIGSTDTSIGGEYSGTQRRVAVTCATTLRTASTSANTMRWTGSWASTKNTALSNIANIGLFDVSTAQGTMLCANTYATSAWNTNQDLYATYDIYLSYATA